MDPLLPAMIPSCSLMGPTLPHWTFVPLMTSFVPLMTSFGHLMTSFGHLMTSFGKLTTSFGHLMTSFGDLMTPYGSLWFPVSPGGIIIKNVRSYAQTLYLFLWCWSHLRLSICYTSQCDTSNVFTLDNRVPCCLYPVFTLDV